MTDSFDHNDLFEAGLAQRRAVLGDAYVDRSLASATDFTRDLQQLVTEYCWGRIWTRDGLSHQTRSIMNLAMMVALNRPHELELHVRGAINNGVTADQIKEVMLQAAVYCGVPAALDGFNVAKGVLDEIAGQ
ncbi:MAG: 4-carboxymuconolactone decarboxylase [Beutenbergiaceae bacterium]